jgi:hypothetical protein
VREDNVTELEGESAAHARARLARRVRRFAIEFAFSLAFVALVLFADGSVEAGGGAAPLVAVIAAAGVLAAWTYVYVRWHLSHDEFERTLELQSVALGAGLAILGATILGLFELVLGGPRVPIVFIAPGFSIVYAIVRLLLAARYR